MRNNTRIDKSILLFPLNRGRAGHYYHYMLGYLMPVVLCPDRKAGHTSLVSVGLLDRITREVLGNDVNIVPEPKLTQTRYPELRNRLSKIFGKSGVRQSLPGTIVKWAMRHALRKHNHDCLEVLSSFDSPLRYRRNQISRFRDYVEARLADRIETKCLSQPDVDVLIIERAHPNKHYADVGRTSGSQRRSVPNIGCLVDLLRTQRRTELLNLENTDLASQIAAFRNARAVVAQHGAALTNIIWMRPGSLVIEIIPPDKVPDSADKEYFSRLAEEMAVRHHYVFQEHDHADLTPSQMHQIEALLAQENSQ